MKAHVEWLVGVIRVGSDFKQFGDDYEFSCTIIRRGDTCEIIGASGKVQPGLRHAIKEALEDVGIRSCTWDRSSGKHVRKTSDATSEP